MADNAIIMQWNAQKQDYCKFRGNFDSVYRSPQENLGEPTDESADVHVLGSIYYNLLTGLMPFYDKANYTDAVDALVRRKETPFIDATFENGTIVQRALINVMRQCWEYNATDRPSIFSVLELLRDTVNGYETSHPNEVRIEDVDLRPLGRPL
jgi:serine/threonine protein kinase